PRWPRGPRVDDGASPVRTEFSARDLEIAHPGDRGDPAVVELVLAADDAQLPPGDRIADDGGLAHEGVDGRGEMTPPDGVLVDQIGVDVGADLLEIGRAHV